MWNEQAREMGRLAKRISGKAASAAVTKVTHNGAEQTRQVDVENALCEVNYAKVRASDDTTFMMEPKQSEFGLLNETPASQQVLDGTYVPTPDTTEPTRKVLRNAAIEARYRRIKPKHKPRRVITTEDHIKGFKRAKEKTSAGLSGLHFGMFKAQIKRRNLAELDASMRSVAYATGYSYKRWKKGVDVELLKRIKDFEVSKLRTIPLLEADFNMNNKCLGADAMHAGERGGALARDNCGGRKKLKGSGSWNEHKTNVPVRLHLGGKRKGNCDVQRRQRMP